MYILLVKLKNRKTQETERTLGCWWRAAHLRLHVGHLPIVARRWAGHRCLPAHLACYTAPQVPAGQRSVPCPSAARHASCEERGVHLAERSPVDHTLHTTLEQKSSVYVI